MGSPSEPGDLDLAKLAIASVISSVVKGASKRPTCSPISCGKATPSKKRDIDSDSVGAVVVYKLAKKSLNMQVTVGGSAMHCPSGPCSVITTGGLFSLCIRYASNLPAFSPVFPHFLFREEYFLSCSLELKLWDYSSV